MFTQVKYLCIKTSIELFFDFYVSQKETPTPA